MFTATLAVTGLMQVHAKNVSLEPTFEQYKVPMLQFKQQKIQLIGRGKWFKTILTDLSKRKANFAGHYVLDDFGCGGGCQSIAVYNHRTGRGFIHPQDFRDCYSEKEGFIGRDYAFKPNSRLLIVTGNRKGNPSECEQVSYIVKGDGFEQIHQRWLYKQN